MKPTFTIYTPDGKEDYQSEVVSYELAKNLHSYSDEVWIRLADGRTVQLGLSPYINKEHGSFA